MRTVLIKKLGQQDYQQTWSAMQAFTQNRDQDSEDQLWLVQHPAVFTLGQAGKREHILNPENIPVLHSDRGGQVTYHGPGQIVIYCLIDLRRLSLGVRALVTHIENSIIESLAAINIPAFAKKTAPGVYVDKQYLPATYTSTMRYNDAKIAALGLRIRKGCSYHGLSLNFDMDLSPFSSINPCGYQDQAVCQVRDFNKTVIQAEFEHSLYQALCGSLDLKPKLQAPI